MTDFCTPDLAQLLTIEQALAEIKASLRPVSLSEKLNLKQALARTLAGPVYSAINVPSDRNSAMDGYAFASADALTNQPFSLKQVGISWAGKPFQGTLKPGECVRIFTGGVVPEQADSVVIQEQVRTEGELIHFPAALKLQQNIREIGEDVAEHGLLLQTGKILTAADLGLLASAGIAEVKVWRQLRIAYFSTGDELVSLGQPLQSGQIYDSNRYILQGLLNNPNYHVSDLGVIADDKVLLEQVLRNAADSYDLMLTTGGASVGEADYINEVLSACGQVKFWKIAMKPGKPVAFGHIGRCAFFGLPGNPVSVVVTFDKIVAPALQYLSGTLATRTIRLQAVCQTKFKKTVGRQEYKRGIFTQQADGSFSVISAGGQGSNFLTSMSQANCYIVLPLECSGVDIGDLVTLEPFSIQL